jgi:hypothetical protein
MATLSLKKAKVIGESPLQDVEGKFVVMRQSKRARNFRFTCYHETQSDALKEANRLAKAMPGCRFLVLQAQGHVERQLEVLEAGNE